MGSCHWLLLTYLVLLFQISYEATSSQANGGKQTKRAIFSWRRGPGFFGMIRQFIRETIRDTNRAIRNLTEIVNSEFPPNPTVQNSTENSTSGGGTARLTIQDVSNILGRNYRSLVRLFNTEFRTAITDSNRNIQRYRVELRDAIRPYFVDGAFSTTTTARTTTPRNRR